jgi:hypothetical protein
MHLLLLEVVLLYTSFHGSEYLYAILVCIRKLLMHIVPPRLMLNTIAVCTAMYMRTKTDYQGRRGCDSSNTVSQ